MLMQIILMFCVLPVLIRILCELARLCTRKRFVWQCDNRWAVVTGASSGVGFEFARQLALKGYNLLLISRDVHRLNEAKQDILYELLAEDRAVQIQILEVDFAKADDIIYEEIEKFLSKYLKDIFILVNNVGVMDTIPDIFLRENCRELNQRMINVNLIAGTKMLEIVLPGMVRNKCGLVITMSAIEAVTPAPLSAIYSATKSYMHKLTETLAEEHRPNNLTFCTFTPYKIATKLHQPISLYIPSPRHYVRHALAQIKYTESFHSTGYPLHEFVKFLADFTAFSISNRFFSRLVLWYMKEDQDF